MEMDEFTDALEKVRSTAADIIALETESLNAMQAAKKGDEEEEEEDGEEGEEECEGHEEGDVGYTTTTRHAGGRANTTAAPRRLNTRGTGSTATTAPPLYQLMNYPECPQEQETVPQSGPRMRKKRNRVSLREQMGTAGLAPQNCPWQSEDQ